MEVPIKKFINRVADFTKIALSEIDDLEFKVERMEQEKEAAERTKIAHEAKLEIALRKAARALYESDFLSSDSERQEFLKKAKEDPAYLADYLEKVCKASDMSMMGIPAKNTVVKRSTDEFDPVIARAFGYEGSPGGYVIDDEDTK